MGSKPQYTEEEIAKAKETIIEELYKGKSLLRILDSDDNLPCRMYVYQWLNPQNYRYDEEFANNYARAREDAADIDSDKIEELNEQVRQGKLTPQQARVIADNLKWTAGKKRPKKYGDKLDLTSDGEKISKDIPPVNISIDGKDIELK